MEEMEESRREKDAVGSMDTPGTWCVGATLRERISSPARKCTFLYSDYISDKRGLRFWLRIDGKQTFHLQTYSCDAMGRTFHRLAYGSEHFKSCFSSTILVLCTLSIVRCRTCSYGDIILAWLFVVQSQDWHSEQWVSGPTTLLYVEVVVNLIITSH